MKWYILVIPVWEVEAEGLKVLGQTGHLTETVS